MMEMLYKKIWREMVRVLMVKKSIVEFLFVERKFDLKKNFCYNIFRRLREIAKQYFNIQAVFG